MTLSGAEYVIEAGPHRVTVVEVGAGLRSYTVDGADVTASYGDDELPPKGCGITLVPWPNRIRDGKYTFAGTEYQLPLTEPAAHNAIHGLGRWERWTVLRHEADAVTLRLDIVPQNGYPFEVRVDVTYALHPEQGLRVTQTATNRGGRAAPFGAGAHPYLSTRGQALTDTVLELPAGEVLVIDDQQVPTGRRPVAGSDHDLRQARQLGELRLDDGFTGLQTSGGRGVAEVRTSDGGARLWFDETYQFLQVFTRDAAGRGWPAIAIEPMTCAPDAFNNGMGLLTLEPGATWTGSWGIVPLPRTDR